MCASLITNLAQKSVRGRCCCPNLQSQVVENLGHLGVVWPLQICSSADEKQAEQTAHRMSEAHGEEEKKGLFHIPSSPIDLPEDVLILSNAKSQPVGIITQKGSD